MEYIGLLLTQYMPGMEDVCVCVRFFPFQSLLTAVAIVFNVNLTARKKERESAAAKLNKLRIITHNPYKIEELYAKLFYYIDMYIVYVYIHYTSVYSEWALRGQDNNNSSSNRNATRVSGCGGVVAFMPIEWANQQFLPFISVCMKNWIIRSNWGWHNGLFYQFKWLKPGECIKTEKNIYNKKRAKPKSRKWNWTVYWKWNSKKKSAHTHTHKQTKSILSNLFGSNHPPPLPHIPWWQYVWWAHLIIIISIVWIS